MCDEKILAGRLLRIELGTSLDRNAIIAGVDGATGDEVIHARGIDAVGIGGIRRSLDVNVVDRDVLANAGHEVKHR
jgi:hypothetical protein